MNKIKTVFVQFVKFGLVGCITFVIDYVLMIVLTEFTPIVYIASCGISYTVATIVNYLLSLRFVFRAGDPRERNLLKEGIFFVILGLIGLGLTELIMYITVETIGIFYALAKILATCIVSVYNFISRKMLLDTKDPEYE